MKLLQTPLYQECKKLGGKMVPFANWEMPVSFSGLIEEHNAVRKNVGMFDISHMGVICRTSQHFFLLHCVLLLIQKN